MNPSSCELPVINQIGHVGRDQRHPRRAGQSGPTMSSWLIAGRHVGCLSECSRGFGGPGDRLGQRRRDRTGPRLLSLARRRFGRLLPFVACRSTFQHAEEEPGQRQGDGGGDRGTDRPYEEHTEHHGQDAGKGIQVGYPQIRVRPWDPAANLGQSKARVRWSSSQHPAASTSSATRQFWSAKRGAGESMPSCRHVSASGSTRAQRPPCLRSHDHARLDECHANTWQMPDVGM